MATIRDRLGLTGGNPLTRRRHSALDDPDVRLYAFASGAGRIAIGVGLAFAPRLALRALGFSDHSPSTVAIARIAGGRDIAMGAVTIASRDDAGRLGQACLANATADAGDAFAFAAAAASGDEQIRPAAVRGVLSAGPAALGGLWTAWRVGALRAPGR